MRFAHIINLFSTDSAEYDLAQRVTIASMLTAKSFSTQDVDVTLLSAQTSEDRYLVPNGFDPTRHLERSVLDVGRFRIKRPFPLLGDILDRAFEATDAEFLIYTNADIGVMPHFYVAIQQLIESGADAFGVTRRTIPNHFDDPKQLPQMYSAVGKKHPGLDCFVFRRDAYPKYELGHVCLGILKVAATLQLNMISHAKELGGGRDGVFHHLHLTFHIGDSLTHTSNELNDFKIHNLQELMKCSLVLKHCEGFQHNPTCQRIVNRTSRRLRQMKSECAIRPPHIQ